MKAVLPPLPWCGTWRSGREIFRRMEQGDEVILKGIGHWLKDVARGLIGQVYIFNPELVIVGGGVSRREEFLMKPLRHIVLTGVMSRFSEELAVEGAVLGNDAGMIGAAEFALLLYIVALRECVWYTDLIS